MMLTAWRAPLSAVAAVLLLGGCAGAPKGGATANGAGDASRATLLASCPGEATSWSERRHVPDRSRVPGAPREEDLLKSAIVGQWYLDHLPRDQAGELRISEDRLGIVIQVTRDAATAQAALQAIVEHGVVVYVERVRYAKGELTRLNDRLMTLDGLRWNSIGVSDGAVEVGVEAGVEGARRLVATVADPCAVRVVQHDTGRLTAALGA